MELLKAPERGMLYALYTDRMEYRPYEREDLLLKEKDLQKNLLELHLFDEKKEYRAQWDEVYRQGAVVRRRQC